MNTKQTADLHIHTVASDGTYTPREILEEAREIGLAAISITDHDSVDSVSQAMSLASDYGIEVIPGIEISVELPANELHLLGYYLDYKNKELLDRLFLLQQTRLDRAREMVKKLERMGFPLDMETLLPDQVSGSIGRLHIAQGLLKAGYIRNIPEAFKRYIGNDGPAYVPKMKISIKEAMSMIFNAGGVPVLAHPGPLNRDDIIPELIELGLVGLEAFYPSYSKFQTNHYIELARYYKILATGGSDFHGSNKKNITLGQVRVPYQVVEELKAVKDR